MSKAKQLRVPDYLEHILEAIERINNYTKGLSELEFCKSTLIIDAVIRNLEIIGEASRNIDRYCPEFSEEYHDLPLRAAYEMRNVLSHGYFEIDITTVWDTVHKSLPKMKHEIEKAYQNYTHQEKK